MNKRQLHAAIWGIAESMAIVEDGVLEVDDFPDISVDSDPEGDPGCYVAAWLWVPLEDPEVLAQVRKEFA
jgi:hypothetical protein